MDEEDEVALKIVNQKKNAATQCSEDQFEEVMNFFEETAQTKQPFAAVDNPPVLNYDEMEEAFDETIEESVRRFAKDIYEHWRSRRIKSKNKRLQPHLKVNNLLPDMMELVLMVYSLRLVKTLMMATPMFASGGAKSDRSARPVVEMLKVRTN